jgi:hypothetical protein
MNVVGLDLNASRARAVAGPAGAAPHALALDVSGRELPMLLSLEGKRVEVGRAAAALCCRLPHLVCSGFLSQLGSPREWSANRHRLDSAKALTLVFEHLRPLCATAKGVLLALPDYVNREQARLLSGPAAKARLPVIGAASAALAAALPALQTAPWSGPALVVDVDDHALTCSMLVADQADTSEPSLARVQTCGLPELGLRTWKARLIDIVSDRCVRHSRRDPRDSAAAEQMLFDQLDEVLDAGWQEQPVEVAVRTDQWCQNLVLRPDEVRAGCSELVAVALAAVDEVLAAAEPEGVRRVLVTTSAGRLPGLSEAIQDAVGAPLIPLAADAAAQGAHRLAGEFLRGERPFDYLDATAPQPAPAPPPPERKKRIFRFR